MKPDETMPEPWARLARWFRRTLPEQDEEAPLGFATRVVAQYQELRRNEAFRAWERLSIRAAFGCATFAIFFGAYSLFNQRQDLRDEVLIEPPIEEPAEIFGLEPAA